MSSKFKDWISRFPIEPGGVIHVGAHLVQERDEYRALGFEPVMWVEAQPGIAEQAEQILERYEQQNVINAALWSSSNQELTFYVAGEEGSSSSILEPYLISASHPQVFIREKYKIRTMTLDELISKSEPKEDFKILVLDVQGAELEVLRGSEVTLGNIHAIIAEISNLELYKGTARINDLCDFLELRDFVFVASEVNRATGWGEGLFIRQSTISPENPIEFEHKVIGNHFAKGRLLRTILIKIGNIFNGGKS